MSLYGEKRDISFFRHISRELVNNVIDQKVGYFKINLEKTESNIYGESNGKKFYNDPIIINCLIQRGDQDHSEDQLGIDKQRRNIIKFLKDDLRDMNLVPEIGDIYIWNEDYYEIDEFIENQLIVGKDKDYSYSESTDDFGDSWGIKLGSHYVRPETLGIRQDR
jgi:hypothetical protein